ncbi:MAG: Molybdopterin molybdenumtransferase [Pseudomonadota bacterium]
MTTSPVSARPPLMSLDEALSKVLLDTVAITEAQLLPTFEADGRALAESLVSQMQVPPQDNSSMDGYALRVEDVLAVGTRLRVTQRIPAGQQGHTLNAGEAARIFTGAPIPPGANAVVMQEDTALVEQGAADASKDLSEVIVNTVPMSGQWIRRSGEDIEKGAVILSQGTRLDPASLGLAASIGVAHLKVTRRPKVALFSTGDELVMPGDIAPQDMRPGAIFNSNRFFLRALLLRAGCEVTDLGIVPDSLAATLEVLRNAADHHDLILTSGGVSVGEEDHVKPAVMQLGHLNLWQISMKPGKPFAFGRIHASQAAAVPHAYFMGLPGNPVSSFVTFQLLVKPFLMALQGVQKVQPTSYRLQAHFDLLKPDKRREFLRAKRNAQGGLDLFANQSSGVLTSVHWGDGLVDNPGGQAIQAGDWVQFYPFSEWLQ